VDAVDAEEEVSLEDLAALSNKISEPFSDDEEAALNEAKETLESKAAEVSRSDTDE
jgi:ribosome maturation factor RimP